MGVGHKHFATYLGLDKYLVRLGGGHEIFGDSKENIIDAASANTNDTSLI